MLTDHLLKNGGSRIEFLENMMDKFSKNLHSFLNETSLNYADLDKEHLIQIEEIFWNEPENWISPQMKATYDQIGEFDLINAIFDKKIKYDKLKKIIKNSTY
jgi:hypothetical protein